MTAAIAAFCLPAACTPDVSSDPPGSRAEQVVETESIELPIIQDFGVASTRPNVTLLNVDAPTIQVGEGKAAIIAVQRPTVSPDCITAAQLRLYLHTSSDLAAGELAVYPSHVFTAVSKRNGDRYGYSGSAMDIRPRATLEQGPSQ